ncbi:hypothetical protein SAMN05421748_126139 [Paractinoplanes atraurantiacus]|uniref:Uncharacterized protein n=1 Tax=Paractinoplanes atraurantiacus TaxID=1036182 RepID=A0A285JWL9_9ACTN|nr:hypothetical protein SAMN05421748_126139 [Actinoplanes atraurantiacus]
MWTSGEARTWGNNGGDGGRRDPIRPRGRDVLETEKEWRERWVGQGAKVITRRSWAAGPFVPADLRIGEADQVI